MADEKTAFIEALEDLPDGVKEFLEVTIPTIQVANVPTTVDEAIIVQGVLAYDLIVLLKPFEGLKILRVLLRIGQHNPVMQGMLLAGLKYIGTVGVVTVEAPIDGGVYFGFFTDFQVTVTEETPTTVTGVLDGEHFEMTGSGENWTALWAVALGLHLLVVTATFEGGRTVEKTVRFQVKSWADVETVPARGESYAGALPALSVETGASTESLSRVNVDFADQTVSLGKGGSSGGGGASGTWEGPPPELEPGTYAAIFQFADSSGKTAKKTVNFTIT